jgi:hypothetical protein
MLASGTYLITITDSLGCIIRDSALISQPEQPLGVDIINVDFGTGKGDAEAEVQGTGGTPPYRYSVDGGMTFQDSGIFRSLPPGQIRIIVRDSVGCEDVIDIFISGTQSDPVTDHWELYPNPAFDYVIIKSGSNVYRKDLLMSVVDQNGRVLKQFNFTGLATDGYKLNCDVLMPGVYTLLINNDNRIARMRFVKL